MQSHSEVLRVRTSIYLWGRMNNSTHGNFHQPKKFPCAPFQSIPISTVAPDNNDTSQPYSSPFQNVM